MDVEIGMEMDVEVDMHVDRKLQKHGRGANVLINVKNMGVVLALFNDSGTATCRIVLFHRSSMLSPSLLSPSLL